MADDTTSHPRNPPRPVTLARNPPAPVTLRKSPLGEISRARNPPGEVSKAKEPDRPVTLAKSPPGAVTTAKNSPRDVTLARSPQGPVTLASKPQGDVTLAKGPQREATIARQPPRDVTLAKQTPGPVTLAKRPPGEVTLAKKPPGEITLAKNLPGPITLAKGPERPVTLAKGPPRPLTLPAQPQREITLPRQSERPITHARSYQEESQQQSRPEEQKQRQDKPPPQNQRPYGSHPKQGIEIPTPAEFCAEHGYNPFPRRWERWLSSVRESIMSAQPVAGRNVTIDVHPGKGTVINAIRPARPPTPTCDLSGLSWLSTVRFQFRYTNNCGCTVDASFDETWTRDDSTFPPALDKFLIRCHDFGGGRIWPQFFAGSNTVIGIGHGPGIEIFQSSPFMEANLDINTHSATEFKLQAYATPGGGFGCGDVPVLDNSPDIVSFSGLMTPYHKTKSIECPHNPGSFTTGEWTITFS